MADDFDIDLEGMDLGDDAGIDLDTADFGDSEGGGDDAGIDLDTADFGDSEGGGDDAGIDLDTADVGDSEGGGESSEGGDSVEFDSELQNILNESEGGGDSVSGDSGDSGGGGGGFDLEISGDSGSGLPAMELTDEQTVNLEFLLDIKLHVTFEVGRAKMLISDLLTLGQGSVIELHRLVGDDLDMLVNGRLVARGEVVVVNEKFGCKINNIIPPEERVKYLGNT